MDILLKWDDNLYTKLGIAEVILLHCLQIIFSPFIYSHRS